MPGVPGSSKKKPFVGPMYTDGTKELDSKANMGRVHGPKGGKKIPDPLKYLDHE